jgi:hypothetical protein
MLNRKTLGNTQNKNMKPPLQISLSLSLSLSPGSHYETKANLELAILLPQPPECWDFRMGHLTWPNITYIFAFWSQPQDQRLTPVILATQEVEIRRIAVQSQPGQTVCKTISKEPFTKKWLVEWLKV